MSDDSTTAEALRLLKAFFVVSDGDARQAIIALAEASGQAATTSTVIVDGQSSTTTDE